jgi:uncharacterized protein HemX
MGNHKDKLILILVLVGISAGAVVVAFRSQSVFHLSTLLSNNLAVVVGMSAGVEVNEYNSLAQQLTSKQTELNERERTLSLRESSLESMLKDERAQREKNTFLAMGFVAALLLVLIGVNFYLDEKRKNGGSSQHTEFQTRL